MKIVFTACVMDLFHKGHQNLLREMRKEAGIDGKVIVVLHDDQSIYETKGKIPVQNYEQRKANIMITGLVDEIIETKGHFPRHEIGEIIDRYNSPKNEFLFMRGNDWIDFPARDVLDSRMIPIKLIPYTEGISSTIIREDLKLK